MGDEYCGYEGETVRIDVKNGPIRSDDSGDALSIDEALSLLSSARRRTLLQSLRERPDERTSVSTVVDDIASTERGGSVATLGRRRILPIRISLRHNHIPKCQHHGVVDFDGGSDTLRYLGDPVVDAYLDVTEVVEGR